MCYEKIATCRGIRLFLSVAACLSFSALTCYAPPVWGVYITNEDETVSYETASFGIGGSNDESIVGTMWWTNDLSGDNGTRSAAPTWQISGIDLDVGINDIKVNGTNATGDPSVDFVYITREAAGSGVPVIDITNQNATLSYDVVSIVLGGTNNAHVIGTMWVSNAANSDVHSFDAAANWQAPSVSLVVGTNDITVSGTNLNSQATSDTVTITRQAKQGGDGDVVYYVATNALHIEPFANWMNAATYIQAAVDLASDGDTVLVTNGLYNKGGVKTPGYIHSNRVYIGKAITVRSVNGPDYTSIKGWSNSHPYKSHRCAYLTNGAVLAGFTLTNGHTIPTMGHSTYDRDGGGAFLDFGGVLSNCVIRDCWAGDDGGGVFFNKGGEVYDCTITNNWTFDDGGGVCIYYTGTITRCAIVNNRADDGGGVYGYEGGSMSNCLVADNIATDEVGGVYWYRADDIVNCTICDNTSVDGGTLDASAGLHLSSAGSARNNIIYFNIRSNIVDNVDVVTTTFDYNCTIPTEGSNCITNDPAFVDHASGNYRLLQTSPCVDYGNDTYAAMPVDLAGNPRIAGTQVDLGAYEYQVPGIFITNGGVSVFGAQTAYTLAGTNVAIDGTMRWTNELNGADGSFAAASPWSVSISLDFGTNTIVVFGTNALGGSTSDTTTITRTRNHGTNSPFHYAAPGGGDIWPYTNWMQAAHVLQDAIDAANDSDTVLVSNGVYNTGGMVRHASNFVTRVVIEKPITVSGVNGPSNTFIVGASDNGTNGPLAVRCVYISTGMVCGFTITNGFTQTEGDWGHYQRGGGVYLYRGGTVSNCIISGCSAQITGGGVDFQYGGLVVDCVIEGNSANMHAGGVNLHDGALLDRCVVRNNTTGGDGTEDGGGLYFWSGGTARNCLITDNETDHAGGGVYFRDDADKGRLESCTVVSNRAASGGGVYAWAGTNINSIIYANTASVVGINWRVASGGTSEFVHCCTTPTNGLDAYDGTGCITNDPQFVGGGDYRLSVASPAINAGTNQAWMAGARDLDGQARNMGPAVDMGCYESLGYHTGVSPVHYAWTNSPSAAWPYTNWTTAAHVIQDAVDTASSGDTVRVNDGVYDRGGAVTPDYGLSNRVCVTRATTLESVNGPSNTFIIGAADPTSTNGPAAVRCVYMVTNTTLSGFTLTNGHTRASGHAYLDRSGGGAFLDHGGTVSNCHITGSLAGDLGGGVFCYGGGELNDCTISGNSAHDGGGAYCNSSGTLNNCMVLANSAGGEGGGAYCDNGGMLNNCTLSANSAASGGGACCFYGGTLNNCTISSNSAGYVGGVYCEYGGVLNNCIAYFNTPGGTQIEGYDDVNYTCSPGLTGDGNITNDPRFIDHPAGNYRLMYGSSCIDAGSNSYVQGSTDLDGNVRIIDTTVDMGAYEYDGATYDSDGDGLTDSNELYVTGTSPTNVNTDGDYFGDYEEMIADTDGANSESYFHLTDIEETNSCAVTFVCTNSRVYSLQFATNLVDGSWLMVDGATNVTGDILGTMSLTDTVDAVHRAYRVGVSFP